VTVLDATVFINFALAGALDTLLRGLAGDLAVAPIVADRELKVWPRKSDRPGEPFDLAPYFADGSLLRAELTEEERQAFEQARARLILGEGEAEALAIALSRGWVLATDDGPARRKIVSSCPLLRLSGSVGMIECLTLVGAITEAQGEELIARMWERGGTPRSRINNPLPPSLK